MEESLLKIYTDPKFPGGFSSVSKLYKEGKKWKRKKEETTFTNAGEIYMEGKNA